MSLHLRSSIFDLRLFDLQAEGIYAIGYRAGSGVVVDLPLNFSPGSLRKHFTQSSLSRKEAKRDKEAKFCKNQNPKRLRILECLSLAFFFLCASASLRERSFLCGP